MSAANPFSDPNYGLEPGEQQNPFSNPDYGKETDGPLARGFQKSKKSAAISRDLTTGDVDSAAQNIAEVDRYARENLLNQTTTSARMALHRFSPGLLNAGNPSSRIQARTIGFDALANWHISARPQRISLIGSSCLNSAPPTGSGSARI